MGGRTARVMAARPKTVGFEHGADVRVVALLDRGEIAVAGVVDEDVDARRIFASPPRRPRRCPPACRRRASAPARWRHGRDEVGERGRIARGGGDAVAAPDQDFRQLPPEAGRAAGDEPDGFRVRRSWRLMLPWESPRCGRPPRPRRSPCAPSRSRRVMPSKATLPSGRLSGGLGLSTVAMIASAARTGSPGWLAAVALDLVAAGDRRLDIGLDRGASAPSATGRPSRCGTGPARRSATLIPNGGDLLGERLRQALDREFGGVVVAGCRGSR